MRIKDSSAPRVDQSWLGELYRRERHRVARHLRGALRDTDDAADATQDAFERLARVGAVTPPRAPRAYLHGVVRNLVIDRSRRARCHPAGTVPISEAILPPVAPAQAEMIEAEDLLRRYRAALDQLTPRTRQVFVMHRVDELTYSAIAARLGITTATVEYHMARALVALATALDR